MKGYIILIDGEFIKCCLRSHKSVTFSVIEAEYSAITEVCCKILVCAVLLFMGVVVEYPITVHIDNVGYIFLSGNTLIYQRKKNTDIHHH